MSTITNITNHLSVFSNTENFITSKYYKTTKYIQENEVLNRGLLDMSSGFLPVALIELIGRNWQSAAETAFGNGLRLITNFLSPLALVPIWNKFAASKHGLPQELKGLFSIQFEDLTPDVIPEKLKEQLLEIKENTNVINAMTLSDITDLKKKLIDAKCLARKLDLMSVGFLTYLSPWIRNWFTKKVLGVVGFTGELNILSDSEREQGASFYERFKYLLFGGGLIPLFLGSAWDANKLKQALTAQQQDTGQDKFINHIKENLKNFSGSITSKGNLFRHNLYGGVVSRIISSRSINEVIERTIRMGISLAGNFWGDVIAHKALAKRYDKKFDTEIIDPNKKEVKSLNKLEKEIKDAINDKDKSLISKLNKSITGQIKTYYQSMSTTAIATGLVTVFSIWNTKRRVDSGKH